MKPNFVKYKHKAPKVSAGKLRVILPRVFSLLKPHVKTIFLGFIGLVLGSSINLLFPYLVRAAINQELGFSLQANLGDFTMVLIVLFAFQSCFFCIRHYCFQVVGLRVVTEIRTTLFNSLINQDMAFFDKSRVGDLLSRISSDTELLQRALTINVSVGLRYLIQVIGGVILLFFISPKLTLVILGVIPLLFLASFFWSSRLRQLSRKVQDQLGEASVIAEEAITSISTVKVFNSEENEKQRYMGAVSSALELGTKRTLVAAFFSSSMVFLLHATIALIIWYGGTLVLEQRLSMGDFSGFLLYVVLVAVSFAFLTSTWMELLQAIGATERIFEVVDEVPTIIEHKEKSDLKEVKFNPKGHPYISFENVSFRYPNRNENIVLNDISFRIREGESVALVGPSGAGKTTVASLLLRLYDPSQGNIYFQDKNLKAFSIEELRKEVAIVSQQPQVFSVSVADNIRYAKPNASADEVLQAAHAASLSDFVEKQPEGIDTLVGDKGIQLSGGEKQRIAIARAILKDPNFLILDEATSSLDSRNESLVQKALKSLMRDRTSLVIAHRLSTVQHVDKVLVLQNGTIEQIGTHKELMAQTGLYRTLVEHQLLQ